MTSSTVRSLSSAARRLVQSSKTLSSTTALSMPALSSRRVMPSTIHSNIRLPLSAPAHITQRSLSASSLPFTRSEYIHPNHAFNALEDGRSVVGTMLAEFRQISAMTLLRNANFDFVIIDNEHGMFGVESLTDLCRTARSIGLTPIVRVPDYTYFFIAQSLDGGAQGLVFPRITSAQQVRDIVMMARYPPDGKRGNAMFRPYSDYKGVADERVLDAMQTHNYETMLIFQIETAESLDELDDILSVDGVDAVLVGPNDLSIALGVAGDWDAYAMQSAFKRVVETCNQHNVVPGIHVSNTQQTIQYAEMGFRLLSANSETGFLSTSANEHVKAVKEHLGSDSVDNKQGPQLKGSY